MPPPKCAPHSLPHTCCTAWAWRWPPPTPSTAAASTFSAACRARSPRFLHRPRGGNETTKVRPAAASFIMLTAAACLTQQHTCNVQPSDGQRLSSHTTHPLLTHPAPPTVRHSTWRPLPPSPARQWTGSGPAHSTVPPCTPAHPGAHLHACLCCKACRSDERQPSSEVRWWPRHGQQRQQC